MDASQRERSLREMDDLRRKFLRDGFLVLEDFLSPEEVQELRKEGVALTDNLPPPAERCLFSTTDVQQRKDRYFLESSDKMRVFFEVDAVDNEGNLKVEPHLALNKVGHALHQLNPVFKRATFNKKVKEVCYRLGFSDPAIVQSMYIYKNPGVGGEVTAHQDASFLHMDSKINNYLVGFWMALDDATAENGCLQFIGGSHQNGVHRRFVQPTEVNESGDLLTFTGPLPNYPRSAFQSVPVPQGTCVLIHGQVVHQSFPNRSSKPRHAYTFHVADLSQGTWSADNWLQLPNDKEFLRLYYN